MCPREHSCLRDRGCRIFRRMGTSSMMTGSATAAFRRAPTWHISGLSNHVDHAIPRRRLPGFQATRLANPPRSQRGRRRGRLSGLAAFMGNCSSRLGGDNAWDHGHAATRSLSGRVTALFTGAHWRYRNPVNSPIPCRDRHTSAKNNPSAIE